MLLSFIPDWALLTERYINFSKYIVTMVHRYEQKLTSLQQELLRLMFRKAGTPLNQRQIANLLNVTQPAVKKALPCLEEQKLISVQQDRMTKRWAIELNQSSQEAMHLKRVDNLKQLYESGLVDYLEKECVGGTILLFGSYSRGEDLVNSDIDIAIIGRKEKRIAVSPFEKMLERKIHLTFFHSVRNIDKNMLDSLCNGIVLVGGVEL